MKKIGFLFALLFVLPLVVFADEPKVLTLETKVDGAVISYNGTVEDGSSAVMCKLFNKSNEQVDMLSVAVDTNKFEGTFTVTEKGEYKVSCANYEGGDFKDATAVVEEVSSNPQTGDNIALWVSLLGVSVIGIVVAIVYVNKKRGNN